jgi:hypothetical protein
MKRGHEAYAKEKENARAVCQTSSWLTAVGVENFPTEISGVDLIAKSKDGKEISIVVAVDAQAIPSTAICIPATDIASSDTTVALTAFHKITKAIGYGTPIPVDRGVRPLKKPYYRDDFEAVSMRHSEFRKVPNPPEAELQKYDKVINNCCLNFQKWGRNRSLMERNQMGIEDLKTYAQVWACSYLGLYKVQKETVNDNVRKLTAFLRQRFAEFAQTLQRKELSCLPSPDTVHVALRGGPFESENVDEWLSTDIRGTGTVEETDENWKRKHAQIDISSAAARNQSAKKMLENYLQGLPHDKMIEILENASENEALCHTAHSEARKRLRLHRQQCSICVKEIQMPVVITDVDEIIPVPDLPAASREVIEAERERISPTPRIEEETVAPVPGKDKARNLYPEAYSAFVNSNRGSRVCTRCKQTLDFEDFGTRLMNGKAAATGSMPRFAMQPQCKKCRAKKT